MVVSFALRRLLWRTVSRRAGRWMVTVITIVPAVLELLAWFL